MFLKKLFITAHFVAALLATTVQPASCKEILRIPYSSDIGTFDPDNGFEIGAMSAINNVYEGLVQYEPGTVNLVGWLASHWEISPDGKEYLFHLVDGVKFHDGSAMTAADVATSFLRRRDSGLALSYFLANVAQIEALDSLTLRFVLKRPQPSFLDTLASPWAPKVISPRALSTHGGGDNAAKWLTEHADGTGPFRLVEFSRAERYVLQRNDDYWGPRPHFDEVELMVLPDISQQILRLKAGDIDAVPTGYPFVQLRSLPANLQVFSAPSVSLYTLFVRPGSPLDDVEIRRAVLTAFDPSTWAKDAFGDFATVAKSVYPHAILSPRTPVVFPTDINDARETVSRRGPIRLTIGLHSSAPTYQRIASLLIARLFSIGVTATAYPLPPGAAFAVKTLPNAPDLLLTIAGPDAAHPEAQAKAFFTRDAPVNFYGRSLEQADRLIDEAGSLADITSRDELYERAGRMIFDAGIAIPLIEVRDVVVHSKRLTDLGLRPIYPPGNIDFGRVR